MAHAVCRDIGKSCCLVTGEYTGAAFLGSSYTARTPSFGDQHAGRSPADKWCTNFCYTVQSDSPLNLPPAKHPEHDVALQNSSFLCHQACQL